MNSGNYRLVFSRHLGMYVPTAEVAISRRCKSLGKRVRVRKLALAAIIALASGHQAVAAPPRATLPTGGAISYGTGNIATNGAAMTVNQSTSKMIVNWSTFNIGADASVKFVQPGSTSAVLNRVSSTGGLSEIYGKMSANGQVYLINPNGILFGSGSTVNVNSLVASSLDIDDELFKQGITSKTDGSAVFSGTTGFVQVDSGALIETASGGKVMMFAPTIMNNGVIHTPDGQTLLAAGEKVYLGVSDDPRLRGLLVEVDSGGTTTNLGQIVAERGNITLAGLAVNQNGRAIATTSVNVNGSIRLQARDTTSIEVEGSVTKRIATNGGKVTMGESSLTEILPESVFTGEGADRKEVTVIDSTKVYDSKIDISGGSVSFLSNAWVVAPSGDVDVYAGALGRDGTDNTNYANGGNWAANSSRVYFASGSGIDVSGVGSGSLVADRAGETAATVAVGSNIVQAELRSNELADSPLQRSGILYKAKVYADTRETGIDGRVGTSIADVSGYAAQIGRTVKERLADGGTVSVRSEGDVVFNTGATVNVSGGKVEYAGGAVNVTKLVDSNGKMVDIADADKSLNYFAIKNVTKREAGYTEGKNAGSVTFSAPAMVLGGSLKGDVVAGMHQRTAATRPIGATLQIGQGYRRYVDSAFVSDASDINAQTNVLHANIIFDTGASNVAIAESGSLTNEQKYNLRLGNAFYSSGFSNHKYYADGQITVNSGANIATPAFGSVSMTASGIDMLGNIVSHGGTVALTAKPTSYHDAINIDLDQGNLVTENDLAGNGNVMVGAGSLIDVSGVWTNNKLNQQDVTSTVVLQGGSISLSAAGSATLGGGDVTLGNGSVLKASGGAWLDSTGKLGSGNGGSIALKASGGYEDVDAHLGRLTLGGTLLSDAVLGGKGGSLSLTSGSVAIGASSLGGNGELHLNTAFFTQGGFTSYNISGYEGVTVENNTAIAPVAYSRILSNRYAIQATGNDLAGFSTARLLSATGLAPTRKTTSLTLNATTESYGNLTLGEGASITVDPGASVSLTGRRQLTVLGDITAHGGSISLAVSQPTTDGDKVTYLDTQSSWIGPRSDLDVSGIADIYVDANGRRVGKVWDGGKITINAYEGAVVAQSGATFNLNGASGTVDVLKSIGKRKQYVATRVDSTGGGLSITALESILFDATMSARGGSASVAAGSFSMNLASGLLPVVLGSGATTLADYPAVDGELVLKATGSSVPSNLTVGSSVSSYAGQAYVFADKLANAGFDRISLTSSGNIRAVENVTVAARGAVMLDAPNVTVDDGVQANIRASYVGFGNSNANLQDKNLSVANSGTGSLVVSAEYLDLFGHQTLNGVSSAQFTSSGDIQMRGALTSDLNDISLVGEMNSAGNLMFSAARIYPSTLSEYTINSSGVGSTITFARNGGGESGVPYSVLGKLTVNADNIVQGGVLRAPFGVIELNANDSLTLADGSLTSVSAEGKTLPFGKTTNGKSWTYDFGDREKVIDTLPDKAIRLNGVTVDATTDSKIDISGGGNLQAWEFTTGTGGSTDVLATSGVYAVLPGLTSGYMAGNSQSFNDSSFTAGDMVYLSGGNGLSAGYYLLLPAHYALMKGAYTVKVVSGKQDMQSFQNAANTDGSMMMSGYRLQSGGITADSRSSGFLVAPGSVARAQSEFTDTLAGGYFKAAYAKNELSGYRLPGDAGRLAISAVTGLTLDGLVASGHDSGARGAEVDISADKIAISNDGSGVGGYLTVDGRQLNAMGAESLLIGGTRSSTAAGTAIDVKSSNVVVTGSGNLGGQEIMLAATDSVVVQNGATISATGSAPSDASDLVIGDSAVSGSGDGALLRVSAGEQRTLVRKGVTKSQGALEVAAGATVHAKRSMILDATFANTLGGTVTLDSGGALRLGAPNISFGNPSGAVSGLLFGNSQLAAIGNPAALQLKSYGTLDFYGNVDLGSSGLKSLSLESAGLVGYDDGAVTLTAGNVQFSNPDSATFVAPSAASHGTLTVHVDDIVLGQNDFNVAGFDTVNLTADKQLIGQGKNNAKFDVSGDLNIDAARITAAGLAKQVINASGTMTTNASHSASELSAAALGGSLKLVADTLIHGGNIDLPSGTVTLQATGAAGSDRLILLAGSHIHDNGTRQTLGSAYALADGGIVNLQTDLGNVRMDQGAVLDVSATGGASAGTLNIDSGGTAVLAGTLSGSAASTSYVAHPGQGSFSYTAASLADFSALNTKLENGGFKESRAIRVKSGDIIVAASDTVTAHQVSITTDDGNLTLAGTINASGNKGGGVALNAGQKAADGKGVLTLASTARIDASATTVATESASSTGDGGKVLLNAVSDSAISDSSGSRIEALAGSVIDVSGKGKGSDGKVTLRAPRVSVTSTAAAGTGMAVTAFDTTVVGDHAQIVAEGVKVYTGTGNLTVNTTTSASTVNINTVKSNNASFLSGNTIATTLGWGADSRFTVAAGDEVRGTGKVTLASDLDLHTWGAGALTVRAVGDLAVNSNLSDGFEFDTATAAWKLSSGGAWTYRLVSGADAGAADLLATNNSNSGNFTLATGKLIRTRTGDIGIATGGSMTLSSATSAIYTVGKNDAATHAELGNFINSNNTVTAYFSENGGDVSIAVKGRIQGSYNNQQPSLWLYRQGKLSNGAWVRSTGWWPVFGNFQSNVGALGGGNVNIRAGDNISDFAAVTATNGRVFDATNTLVVNGGGDLTVRAGGDILGGLYMADKGLAILRSDGVIGSSGAANKFSTAFALGDAKLDVAARDTLTVQAVFNPTLLGSSPNNRTTDENATLRGSFFSTYGEDSSVSLTSLAAGVNMSESGTATNFANKIASGTSFTNATLLTVLPGSLKVVALNGDVNINKDIVMMPAATGGLQMAASGSLKFNSPLVMSDMAPESIPSALSPLNSTSFVSALSSGVNDGPLYHAATTLHQGDDTPVVFYAGKDIVGVVNSNSVTLPKKADIVAGRDIVDFTLHGQNIDVGDVTTMQAGRDLKFNTSSQFSNGRLTILQNKSGIFLGGPGYLDISAGRDVDLGNAVGILTRGNLANPYLSETGASLSVLAGTSGTNDAAFIAKYINPTADSTYRTALIGFVESVSGQNGLDTAAAWTAFGNMSAEQQHQLVQTVFFNELKQNAISNLTATSKDYTRGRTAISTLFPNASSGDINLAFSQIKTERGGDLSLLAPGGGVVVGLPVTPPALVTAKEAGGTSAASQLGVFTVRGGAINTYSRDSVEVAKSRVFTVGGGDIVMWSNTGDIDAGKGSKTATSAPPPLIRTDSNGNTVVDLSGVVSGSGIGTLQTISTAKKSDVYLIAPSGTINAGDAGVRSSGNIFVDAARVTNADNFQAAGGMSGVPQGDVGALSFNIGGVSDSSASATKSGEAMGQQKNASALGNNESFLPSFITVEVIGFGNANDGGKASDDEDEKRNKKDAKSKKG